MQVSGGTGCCAGSWLTKGCSDANALKGPQDILQNHASVFVCLVVTCAEHVSDRHSTICIQEHVELKRHLTSGLPASLPEGHLGHQVTPL